MSVGVGVGVGKGVGRPGSPLLSLPRSSQTEITVYESITGCKRGNGSPPWFLSSIRSAASALARLRGD